jgi:hypothetical protein
MCPACFTTLALIAAGAFSTGGLATLIVKKGLTPRGAKANLLPLSAETNQGGNRNGNEDSDCERRFES